MRCLCGLQYRLHVLLSGNHSNNTAKQRGEIQKSQALRLVQLAEAPDRSFSFESASRKRLRRMPKTLTGLNSGNVIDLTQVGDQGEIKENSDGEHASARSSLRREGQ